jgi:energy-coupling factor transport system substrate-specific component
MDLWFWPFGAGPATALSFQPGAPLGHNLARFLAFYATTSMGFDIPRAVLNAVLVLAVGRPVISALRRAGHRAAFEAPVEVPAAGGAHESHQVAARSGGEWTTTPMAWRDGSGIGPRTEDVVHGVEKFLG